MSWAYNDIDIYVTDTENILGETSVANWVSLSNYGILRGRPALTLSTVEGDSITIKKKDGRPMSIDSSRGNAKLEFEILVADTWVFKSSQTTVYDRIDILLSILNQIKRVSYKEPGKDPYFYYIVYKTSLTLNDADEKAATIKVSMDIHPYEFFFVGNVPVAIESSEEFNNILPCSRCMPTYIFSGSGELYLDYGNGDVRPSVSAEDAPEMTVLDTFTGLVYGLQQEDNRNRYMSGLYSDLWFDGNSQVTVHSTFSEPVVIYTRKGIVR